MVCFVVGPGTPLPFHFVWPAPLTFETWFLFLVCPFLHQDLDWCFYKLLPCVFDVWFYYSSVIANSF